MRLVDAQEILNELSNRPFREIFSPIQLNDIIRNKGKTGQLLEIALGLDLTNTNLDFDDGELKTNKCDRWGNPKETVFITQISSIIDDLILERPFEYTHLYEKIDNILYVPVCKDGSPENWMFLPSININLHDRTFEGLRSIWENDYYRICEQLKFHIENSADGYIHTSNGAHIQVRSKDSKPYHPIYSSTYNRYVSNKNHAFYFKKEFVHYIRRIYYR